jgi:hypothetical protein
VAPFSRTLRRKRSQERALRKAQGDSSPQHHARPRNRRNGRGLNAVSSRLAFRVVMPVGERRSASFEGMFVHRRNGPRTSAGVRLGREQLRPLSRARSCRTDQAARAAVERRLELVSPMIEDEERCSARPMISSRRWVRGAGGTPGRTLFGK